MGRHEPSGAGAGGNGVSSEGVSAPIGDFVRIRVLVQTYTLVISVRVSVLSKMIIYLGNSGEIDDTGARQGKLRVQPTRSLERLRECR